MAERQTNYTIGEDMELPSKGLIYDKQQPALVELRSMTARDEMKRLSPSTTQFKNLADIIEGCMIEKPAIHVYDMALGDYEYLLHKLRIVTYGDAYKMTVRCPHCLELIDTVAHLDDLEVKHFDFDKFEELRILRLPKSGNTVALKYQTPRMLDEVEAKAKELKRKFKNSEIDFNMLTLLTSVIDTVDGQKLDSISLENFINRLPALDMMKIVNGVDAINALIGIDNTIIISCDKCGGEVPTTFRFGPEFFRPSTI